MFDLSPRPDRKEGLSLADYCKAADALKVPLSTIRAVDAVESAGSGFLPSGRPKILFEGHIFHRLTNGRFDKTNPTVSYPKWTTKFYKGGEAEYQRLEEAIKLDANAALKAASWGRFQILGGNYDAAGCFTVENFVERCFESEYFQLVEFVDYVDHEGLAKYLRIGQFAGFAERYNGSSYQRNHYDTKLSNANAKFAKIKVDCRALRTPARIEEVYPADCRQGCSGMDNSSLDDRYLDSPQTSPVHAPSASVAGPTQSSETETNSQSPTVTIPNNSGGDTPVQVSSSLSESLDHTLDKATIVQEKVNRISGLARGFDDLKSLVKFLVLTVKQLFVFLFCFLAGIPAQYWLVIAAVALIAFLGFMYRRQILDLFRGKS
jgi:hypothetical protein